MCFEIKEYFSQTSSEQSETLKVLRNKRVVQSDFFRAVRDRHVFRNKRVVQSDFFRAVRDLAYFRNKRVVQSDFFRAVRDLAGVSK